MVFPNLCLSRAPDSYRLQPCLGQSRQLVDDIRQISAAVHVAHGRIERGVSHEPLELPRILHSLIGPGRERVSEDVRRDLAGNAVMPASWAALEIAITSSRWGLVRSSPFEPGKMYTASPCSAFHWGRITAASSLIGKVVALCSLFGSPRQLRRMVTVLGWLPSSMSDPGAAYTNARHRPSENPGLDCRETHDVTIARRHLRGRQDLGRRGAARGARQGARVATSTARWLMPPASDEHLEARHVVA
jgi:hypothetical protein